MDKELEKDYRKRISFLNAELESTKINLRDQFAMAASDDDIESILPTTQGDIARFLGLNIDFNAGGEAPENMWHTARCKARYIHADAMLKTRG